MASEQAFFLKILSDHSCGIPSVIPDGLNWDIIQNYAKTHQLEGIVFAQTHRTDFQQAYAFCMYTFANRRRLEASIQQYLNKNGIPFFTVKGTSVAEFFPVPALRTMGDSDIVVHSEDRERVHEFLISLGFSRKTPNCKEWMYFKNGMEVEIHDHLLYDDIRNTDSILRFDAEMWNYVKDNTLDWSYHFVFLILHLRKHFLGEGVGFRQFLDIAVICQKDLVDWVLVERWLNQLQITSFTKTILTFNERWFGIRSPLATEKLDDEFFEQATQKVFENGVFGFDDEENESNKAINEQKVSGRIGSVRRLLSDVFYPYDKLIAMSEYGFLKGRPILLPIAWIYRIAIKWKKRKLVRTKYIISQEIVDARDKMLKQWGL